MIIPDLNLLIYANNHSSAMHADALIWWEALMNGEEEVGLPWVVLTGFMRLSTSSRPFSNPLTVEEASTKIRRWCQHPKVRILAPGPRHLDIWIGLLTDTGAGGNLTTDAHIAAFAIEYRAMIHSCDSDFARYKGLRWKNPLKA